MKNTSWVTLGAEVPAVLLLRFRVASAIKRDMIVLIFTQ